MSRKLIIGVNPNENTMRDPNPHVPFTAAEIARDAAECQAAGASLMHFHARGPAGEPEHGAWSYADIMRAVRAESDLLLAPSPANVPGRSAEQRLANIVDIADDPATRADFLVAEMGCANMDLYDPATTSFQTTDKVFVNDTATQQYVTRRANELGMKPFLASFTVSWTRAITAHLDSGAVAQPAVVAIVLGGPEFLAAHPATPAGLRAQVELLPRQYEIEWFASAYRGNVLDVAETVIELGGHVTIGVGDYHYRELGLPTNAELVAKVAEVAAKQGREVASPHEARQLLGIGEETPCHS